MLARVELDHRLLALLLLGDHFRADRDAGHVLEFLVVLGEQVAARALDQEHLDLLALEPLPVERALRAGRRRAKQRARGGRARHGECGLQKRAPARFDRSTVVVAHCLPPGGGGIVVFRLRAIIHQFAVGY